jgi:[protein-PII] uridylyltransferase
MIEVASDDLYQRQPHAILETFLLYQTHGGHQGPVGAHPARAVQRARRDGRQAFRNDPVNRAPFMAILQQPRASPTPCG